MYYINEKERYFGWFKFEKISRWWFLFNEQVSAIFSLLNGGGGGAATASSSSSNQSSSFTSSLNLHLFT